MIEPILYTGCESCKKDNWVQGTGLETCIYVIECGFRVKQANN